MNRNKRITQLKEFIKAEVISVENGATPYYDDGGKLIEDIATCGNVWPFVE